MQTTNTISLRIAIDDETYRALDQIAKARNQQPEDVAADMLAKFRDVRSTKPIIISDDARRRLEQILGRNLSAVEDLLSTMQHAFSVRADGVEIPVTPYLLERLRSRCIGMDFTEFMKRTVKRLLEEFANIR
jgi:hypothetical protein